LDSTQETFTALLIARAIITNGKRQIFWTDSGNKAFALISYSEQGQPGEERYHNYAFTREREGWQTKVDIQGLNYFLLTTYLPQEVESINHSGILQREDFESIIYFVAKTENERKAANELDRVLLALKKEIACLPQDFNESACVNMTPKDCNNANFIQKIVVFKENEEINETSIEYIIPPLYLSKENNCLAIEGNSVNLIRAIDKVIFVMFDIIKEDKK
jgi:hypothetical protein